MLRLLDDLDEIGFHRGDLFLDEAFQRIVADWQEFERGMRHDHDIPIVCSDRGQELAAIRRRKVILSGAQDIRIGIRLDRVFLPLLRQVIRHDDRELVRQLHAL